MHGIELLVNLPSQSQRQDDHIQNDETWAWILHPWRSRLDLPARWNHGKTSEWIPFSMPPQQISWLALSKAQVPTKSHVKRFLQKLLDQQFNNWWSGLQKNAKKDKIQYCQIGRHVVWFVSSLWRCNLRHWKLQVRVPSKLLIEFQNKNPSPWNALCLEYGATTAKSGTIRLIWLSLRSVLAQHYTATRAEQGMHFSDWVFKVPISPTNLDRTVRRATGLLDLRALAYLICPTAFWAPVPCKAPPGVISTQRVSLLWIQTLQNLLDSSVGRAWDAWGLPGTLQVVRCICALHMRGQAWPHG